MGILTEDETKKITEEEEMRAKIRRKYEQKSSGTAAVLSTLCPGLGQVYNGQVGKGTAFFFIAIVGLVLLSFGITFWMKPDLMKSARGKGVSAAITEEKAVKMNEEGVVVEEEKKEETAKKETKKMPAIPPFAGTLTMVGLLGLGLGGSLSVRDAIRTAKRLNESA
jgi:hypothetical protein